MHKASGKDTNLPGHIPCVNTEEPGGEFYALHHPGSPSILTKAGTRVYAFCPACWSPMYADVDRFACTSCDLVIMAAVEPEKRPSALAVPASTPQ